LVKLIMAMMGDDIILPCHLEPAVDAGELTVEWSRQDLTPRFVYKSEDGVELLTEQNSLYTRRTSLSVSKLQCGDISLKLSTVKLSDAGTYKCLVPTYGAESVVQLAVVPSFPKSFPSSGKGRVSHNKCNMGLAVLFPPLVSVIIFAVCCQIFLHLSFSF
uniref:Ig-like domain-containing protein n=1 Tax=Amphilophus citrinellus TaxID=61819 RepID=A0A3Q0S3S9_AMPCI